MFSKIKRLILRKRSRYAGCDGKSTDTVRRPDQVQRSREHRSSHQNECIVVHTTADIHEEVSGSSAYHCDPDNDPPTCGNIRHANQVLRSDSADERTFDVGELTSKTKHADLHQNIVEEVAEFYQTFTNPQTDIRILVSKNVIVYVLGTNHANIKCKDDVVDVIQKVKPRTVLVELCSLRACSCTKHKSNAFQSSPKFTFRYLRTTITQLGFLPAMIFFTDVFREHLVSESSLLHYGGEFIAAMTAAQSMKSCQIILADRPIEITVKRQASAIGNWRGLRITLQVTLGLMFKKHMKPLMVNANRLVFDDPKTYEVLVFERDLYLTYSIQEAAKRFENANHVTRIVAVIGQGHMQGIQAYWGKVPSEFIPFLMSPQTILDQ